jgi:hypothetical protein
MSVDLVHPGVEKVTLVLEGIGDDRPSMSVDLMLPAAEKITPVSKGSATARFG